MSEVRLIDANKLLDKKRCGARTENCSGMCEQCMEYVVEVEDIITAPTVAERQKGEWKDYSDEGYVECPFCGSATTCDDNKDELHYCWNCGSELR